MSFVALFVTLTAKQSAGRMRVWRALKALGAGTLRDGVYLLPDLPAHRDAMEGIAKHVRAVDGTAVVYQLNAISDRQGLELVALFDRSAEYAVLIDSLRAADAADSKGLRTLRREFAALASTDFFPGEAQRQAQAALQALEARAVGEPANLAGSIRRLASADFCGRSWATRKHPWVDRLASAWLIRRFIDPQAKFLWLDDPAKAPSNALGFDYDGASFSHGGGHVTFEVLMLSFGLDVDAALARIAAIVHFLDVGGVPVPEATGVEAVLAGARAGAKDDDALLIEAMRTFDHLHRHYSQADHD